MRAALLLGRHRYPSGDLDAGARKAFERWRCPYVGRTSRKSHSAGTCALFLRIILHVGDN